MGNTTCKVHNTSKILHDIPDTHDNTANKNRWEGNIYIYMGEQILNQAEKQKIEHVKIHESVSIIHDEAFANCTNLKIVEFSKNHNNMIKKIGNRSFNGCRNLPSINLQDSQKLELIGDRAFCRCEKLTSIQFPSSIRQIGRACFQQCDQLKAIDLSHANKFTSIEAHTFSYCSALKIINLPSTVSCIGRGSFYCCNALEVIDFKGTCIKEIKKEAFYCCTNLTTVSFPTAIKSIEKDSFYNCSKLLSLDLQKTCIETIGDNAFYECGNLTTINFPMTLKYIGKYCFYYCTKLQHLNLQETSIEYIKEGAFYNCNNLTTVTGISTTSLDDNDETVPRNDDGSVESLPASLVEIGKDSFFLCPKLKNKLNNNWIHYECDLNRGGRQFLQRQHHQDDKNTNDDDGDNNRSVGKVYHSGLWPLILNRTLNKMELPQHRICRNDDNLSLCTEADRVQRGASVGYYLMVNGVIADLQS